MSRRRILIIDDERNFREFLAEALQAHDYEVMQAATAAAGLLQARQYGPHVVLLDQNLPDRSGLDLLPELRQLRSNPVTIVMTAYGAYPKAVAAIKAGAYHYLVKPFDFSDLLQRLSEACIGIREGTPGEEPDSLTDLIGEAPEIIQLRRSIRLVARSRVMSILIQGESGTGKELVARGIHKLSDRARRKLISINCAALTETLLMSELFGHERGAFTDAKERKKGLFEAAQGGTLFLDEIGEMGPRAQAALLRVLEQRTIMPVGSTNEIPVDVRIVAATNRSLEESIAANTFRADLFYRLNVVRIEVPPLRVRGGDVLLLARFFSGQIAREYGVPERTITPDAERILMAYPWPGNVRELRNAIERAYALSPSSKITPADLPPEIRNSQGLQRADGVARLEIPEHLGFRQAKQLLIASFERDYLRALLSRTGGNISQAAEEAGILRQALQRLLRRHGLDRHEFVVQE
jgi:DNA-binding NtrC family response regulator